MNEKEWILNDIGTIELHIESLKSRIDRLELVEKNDRKNTKNKTG